jgi:hypothetical protein
MERGQIVFIAIVVGVLGLFALKVWSDRTTESAFDMDSRGAAQRLARAGGLAGGSDDSGDGNGIDGSARPGRPGGPLRPGASGSGGTGGGSGGGGRLGGGPDGRGGGSTDVVRGGGTRLGSGVGYSGSGRAGDSGSGASVLGGVRGGSGAPAGHLAPNADQRQKMVDFLGSQPPTQADLASPKTDTGEDVALKIDKPEDITKQGGQDQNVQQADDGDGIKITDDGNIKFPNNVNPDSATISFKIEPQWAGSDQTDNALVELRGEHEWANRLELVKNGEFLRFILTDNTGVEHDISARITDWQAGDPHDVQASYGDGKTSLYIDGRLAGTTQYTGQLQFPDGIPLHVGGDYAGSNYAGANATIQGLTITNSASH